VIRKSLQEPERRRGRIRRDLYIIDMKRERNYYNCGRFGHITRWCKSWRIIG